MGLYFLFFYIIKGIYKFLDWWNGTYVDLENQLLIINYRYRSFKYTVHIPYDGNIGRRIAFRKEKGTLLNYQDGIKVMVDAQKIGYDEIKEETFDD